MPEPSYHSEFSDEVRERFQQVVAGFVEAWRNSSHSSGEVTLEAFLPPQGDSLRMPLLHELIPLDLEQRRKRGESILLEKYLTRFPELGAASDLPVEMIRTEYRIRQEQGGPLRLESYRARFPKQFEALAALVLGSGGKPSSNPDLHSMGTLQPGSGDSVADSTPTRRTVADANPPMPAVPEAPGEARKVMPVGEGYKLLKCIGRGMFGEVWKAEAPGGVEVAVKMIHRTAGDQLTQMELRALELMKRLRHPFLLQVQAYWLSGDQLHIVMDLAEKTLLQRLEECERQGHVGIPAPELVGYFREAAEALDFLHSNHVLHRDVKPANILLSNGHARLADFGLARLFMKNDTDLRATMTGTPLYMGPEVWQQKVSPESDQYSLAATYVELRTGQPIFDADSQDQVKQSHLKAAPSLKGMSTAERKVLQKALAKKLEDRFKTCSQFIEELELAALGPSHKNKSWLTRRRAIAILAIGTLTAGATFETARRLGWLNSQPLAMEVTAPAAITLRAGEEQTFQVHIVDARNSGELKPEFTDIPEGVRFELGDAPTPGVNAQIWRVTVAAPLNMLKAAEGTHSKVTLRVADVDESAERVIELTIDPPLMTVPPNCQLATGAKRVAESGANYWDRIVRRLPGDAVLPSGQPCEFVLIPSNSTLKLPCFYMLKNKVWNELFTVFDKQYVMAHPRPAKGEDESDWPDDWAKYGAAKGAEDMPAKDYPLHPVMNVTYKQADEFAKWLGGALPTCPQWDTAAGVYVRDDVERQGPFLGTWIDSNSTGEGIAIHREGTLSIKEANDDVSPLGCRHMAGNGEEWTRDDSGAPFSTVTLRGRQYRQGEPFMYRDLLDKNKLAIEQVAGKSPYIGFRIVIEIRP